MANGVSTIGAGWDDVPQGSAEFALGQIIEEGKLSGEAVITDLIVRGYDSRGPAYYPEQDGKGPFYALGNPHTYTSIETVDGERVWNLTRTTDDPLPVTVTPTPTPTPAPTPAPNVDIVELIGSINTNITWAHGETRADIAAARDAIIDRISVAQEAIQQQIDQVVKNAEATGKTLLPIVEAALPALAGLFAKK